MTKDDRIAEQISAIRYALNLIETRNAHGSYMRYDARDAGIGAPQSHSEYVRDELHRAERLLDGILIDYPELHES